MNNSGKALSVIAIAPAFDTARKPTISTNFPPPVPMPSSPAPMGFHWQYDPTNRRWFLEVDSGYYGYVYGHNHETPIINTQQAADIATDIPATISSLVANNKPLVYIGIGAALLYFFGKK